MPNRTCAIAFLIIFMTLSFGGQAPADTTASQEIAAVSATLDAFHAAASKADGRAYFDLFAPDGVFIGTDASERWTVAAFKTYALPLFAEGKGWTYVPRAGTRHITLADIPCGCVAWFDELLDNVGYGTSRGTGMLMLTPAGWKIEQYALTFPIPNDLAKEMTAKIKAFAKH
jgi:SnoaL-like domain